MVWQVVLSELIGAISGLSVGAQLTEIAANIGFIDTSIQTFKTSVNTDMDAHNSYMGTIDQSLSNTLAEITDMKIEFLQLNTHLANTIGLLTDINATMELTKDELQVIGSRISSGDQTLTQALAPLEELDNINDAAIAINDKMFALVEEVEGVGEKVDTVAVRIAPDGFSLAQTATDLVTGPIVEGMATIANRMAPEDVSVWSAIDGLRLALETLEATQTAGVNVATDTGLLLGQIEEHLEKLQQAMRPGDLSAFLPSNEQSILKFMREDSKELAEWLFKALIRVDEVDGEGEPVAWTTRLSLIETAIKFLATVQTFLEMTTYDGTRVVVGTTVVPSDLTEF